MPADGSLENWQDIVGAHAWQTLLLGNGLSINVWSDFAYTALFDHAKGAGLTAEDLALFGDTPNFENVLGDLNTAARVSKVLGLDTRRFLERYQHIQEALGHAVRAVHLTRDAVGLDRLRAIRAALAEYEWLFTTSYDLLVYWAMGVGPNDRFMPFVDLFKLPGGRHDPEAAIRSDWIPVYFLHGALHLVVGGDGMTRKRKATMLNSLLDQFGQPVDGDPHARPLLVTEGSARDKIRAIEGNAYLSHALERLRARAEPLVAFGSSLGTEDQHLVDALNEHPDRPVAVSMFPGRKRDLAVAQADIYARLEVDPLLFFDSTTHPLGAADLRVSA